MTHRSKRATAARTMNLPTMTAYPRNSPQAAARIVALAMIANGRLQPVALDVLSAMQAYDRLRLPPHVWHEVVDALCADLLATSTQGAECRIDSALIEQMLADIDDESLQRLVLRLCMAVASADGLLESAESIVLLTAIDRWGLHPDEQHLLEPLLYGLDFQVTSRGAMHGSETMVLQHQP